ncbi:MAG: hydrolase [Cellulomonas sp.]|nr:hydrolase [Cellulomonas sp.]
MDVVEALTPPPSPARTREAERGTLVVGAVQTRWRADPVEQAAVLDEAIAAAAQRGAQVVFCPELTLSRYPADARPTGRPLDAAEPLVGGPTHTFAARAAARHEVLVHASLYEATDAGDGRGYNTAVLVGPDGQIQAATRKVHIPVTAGYVEDAWFAPAPADDPYPVVDLDLPGRPRIGMPTCWDQWFSEVSRAYALGGADLVAYPTAIGSEPDHPGFDTEPLWRTTILGQAIGNGLFVVAANRWGDEGLITFYGSSFVADPYGRVLARAPRDTDAVLVTALDLDARRDWLELFPFLGTRRPDTYGTLTQPVAGG